MSLLSDTTATTTTTMEPVSHWGDFSPQIQEQTDYINERETTNPSSSSIDHDFNESECLFCDQSSSSLDDNLVHMSKVHGLHVTTRNLLVDVGSLMPAFGLYCSVRAEVQDYLELSWLRFVTLDFGLSMYALDLMAEL